MTEPQDEDIMITIVEKWVKTPDGSAVAYTRSIVYASGIEEVLESYSMRIEDCPVIEIRNPRMSSKITGFD